MSLQVREEFYIGVSPVFFLDFPFNIIHYSVSIMQLFLIKIVQNFKNCKIRENTGKRIACGAGKWYNKKMEEKTDIQKVFIAGGTGFLGMPAAEKFEKAGIGVCSASLSGGKNCVKFDLFSAAEEEIAVEVGAAELGNPVLVVDPTYHYAARAGIRVFSRKAGGAVGKDLPRGETRGGEEDRRARFVFRAFQRPLRGENSKNTIRISARVRSRKGGCLR